MKVLITGAAGFIGSTLVDTLRNDYDVRAIDNFSVGHVRRIGDITVEEMDVTQLEHVEEMVCGRDVVVHLAGYTGIPACENDPEGAARNILVGTKYITEASVRAGVKQLLFSSSFAVYGDAPTHVSECSPVAPIGMYGNLRAASEYVLLAARHLDGLNTLIFRQTNVYGKGVTTKRTVVNLLSEQVLKREAITVYGTGEQVRNFVHVLDTVRAYKLAIERGSGGLYNLGSAETLSVNDIVRTVNDASYHLLGYQVPVEHKPDRGAGKREIASTELVLDVRKVQRELGWTAEHTVRGTVEQMLAAPATAGAR